MRLQLSFFVVALVLASASIVSAQIPPLTQPKVIVDGQWGPTFPSNVRGADKVQRLASGQSPSLASKVSSLSRSFSNNASQPRVLPNLTLIAQAKLNSILNNNQTVDLGPKQNVRRAVGQVGVTTAAAANKAATAGDSILYWNAVALEVYANAATTGEQPGPILGSRALSIVHLSMYDAFAGALGNPADLPKYLPQLPSLAADDAARASPQAAVAGAAYQSLLKLYPSQRALLDEKLVSFCDNKGPLQLATAQPSLVWGAFVADAILQQRASDPTSNIAVPFAQYSPPAGVNVGSQYQPDPVTPAAPLYAPYYGATAPLFATTQRFTVDPVSSFAPPGSAFLEADRQNVQQAGIAQFLNATGPLNGVSYPRSTRTPEQNITAIYWAYDGQPKLGTPPRAYNQFVRKVAVAKGNTESQNARLFAFVNAGLADVGTLTWAEKYAQFYNRPVTAIRALGQFPAWLPLGSPTSNRISSLQNWTPNFPSYPAGHSAFGAAAFQLVRLFYGVPAGPTGYGPDNVYSEDFVSGEFNGVTFNSSGVVRPLVLRGYKNGGLWKAIVDNANSRTWLGVHWTFDSFAPLNGDQFSPDLTKNVGALPLGLKVAEDMWSAGGGVAPKFVGTPVTLPPFVPASSSAAASVSVPAGSAQGGVDGGALYRPMPGELGEVSGLFVEPVVA